MTDSLFPTEPRRITASPQTPRLESLLPGAIKDELATLHRQLLSLRASELALEQRATTLERLYTRTMVATDSVLAALTDAALPFPIPQKTRQLIRSLQLMLRMLADDLQTTLNNDELPAVRRPTPELTLWRSLHVLARHVLISDLIASPATVGVWRQLHQTYETARRLELTDTAPPGADGTLQATYYTAVLLGCGQPASFTSSEVNFVAAYLARFSDAIDPIDELTAQTTPAAFWIDPLRDAAAFACSRNSAPPDTAVHYFSCARLAARLKQQLAELATGTTTSALGLPELATTPTGRGVLRRLVSYWGEPGKRRFPRRRQNYRAILCSGLDNLWRLFQDGDAAVLETSNWMVTNESPDGYAFMHVTGKTGDLSVGDITAIRTESGKAWQICIVRWALSENQEHLELGLQILSTRAIPARLARPAHKGDRRLLPVLLLPEIRALRATEMLVGPSGVLGDQPTPLILVVESKNIAVREVKSTRLDEQNSLIAVVSIEPDTPPQAD